MALGEKKSAIFAWNTRGVNGDFTNQFFRGRPAHASTRLQILPAIDAARQLGCSPRVISLAGDSGFLNHVDQPAICVFSKMTADLAEDQDRVIANCLALYARMRARGVPVVLLYCDHHAMSSSPVGSLYQDLLRLADLVVCPSSKMAELAGSICPDSSSISVVEDVCVTKRQPFLDLTKETRCRLLWFGSDSNASFLVNILPSMLLHCDGHSGFELTVMGRESTLAKVRSISGKLKSNQPWEFRFILWDPLRQPAQLENELTRAHLVLIPSDPENIWKLGVSHNRLVDGVQGGCVVIASPMPSYIELSKISLVGDDFPFMINSAISQYSRLCRKYDSLRNEFLSRFMPTSVQARWREVLSI